MALLFKHPYPASVWEAVMYVVVMAEKGQPVRNCARQVICKNHKYEAGLNLQRDTVWVRWYVDGGLRDTLNRKMEGWITSRTNLEKQANMNVPQNHPTYKHFRQQIREARWKLQDLEKLMEDGQRQLSKDQEVIYEQRKIADLTGFLMSMDAVLVADADIPVRKSNLGREKRAVPLNLARTKQSAGKKAARKGKVAKGASSRSKRTVPLRKHPDGQDGVQLDLRSKEPTGSVRGPKRNARRQEDRLEGQGVQGNVLREAQEGDQAVGEGDHLEALP